METDESAKRSCRVVYSIWNVVFCCRPQKSNLNVAWPTPFRSRHVSVGFFRFAPSKVTGRQRPASGSALPSLRKGTQTDRGLHDAPHLVYSCVLTCPDFSDVWRCIGQVKLHRNWPKRPSHSQQRARLARRPKGFHMKAKLPLARIGLDTIESWKKGC